MEPLLSNVSSKTAQGEARDLQLRLYREIGISAVVAALNISDVPLRRQTATPDRATAKSEAA